jgi:hypothetical protein
MKFIPDVDQMEYHHGVTFGQLVNQEPRLERLLWEARKVGATCRSQADVLQAFATVRNQLSELIGFSSRHRVHRLLGSVGAYEVAYWKLFHAIADLVPGATRLDQMAFGEGSAAPEEVRALAASA